jgi:4a-hydroxytetrahydrobiopterin dehydratase
MDWTSKRCLPCEGGVPRLGAAAVDEAVRDLPGWATADEGTRLHRRFEFPDFVTAMRFVNAMAEVAEQEGHHPDFAVHSSRVDVTLWTHAARGLTENDFILAAKLGARPEARSAR